MINGSGSHQAQFGQVLHSPAHMAVSLLLLASVLSSMERSRHRWTREASAMWGSRQSRQLSSGWPPVVSEQAHLGAYPHLNPKCKRSGWPNQRFPPPPVENHGIMAYPALEGAKRILKHTLQNQHGHQNHVAWSRSHPHLLPASLRQKFEGCSGFYFFLFPLFSLYNFVLVMTD